ncbi:MFS transporter [Streptomyces sp. NBC_00487]|nr:MULTISPECIES: hypothetical protein [unclassified Streptomyces]WRY93689.1 MFS transporter [Streptomyces sp. NBC_00481]
MLLLTLYGGRIADRYDRRRSLMVCNLVSGGCALALAVPDLGGAVRLWHVFLFALCLATVDAVEVPTRMSFAATARTASSVCATASSPRGPRSG